MKKRYRNMQKKANGKVREIGDGRVLLELPLSVAGVIESLPGAIRDLAQEAGMLLMSAAMTAECETIAGPKNTKNPLRRANWWGGELSPVYYDKQKMLIDRPRLRGKDNKEISLATFEAFRNPKCMRNSVMKDMLLGISSRNYEEAVSGFMKGYGIKRSSVSRHFVKATAEQMREFLERDLTGFDLVAIFIDGIEFKGHLLVVALGLDKAGRKHVLGLRQGATENATVCVGLLEDMVRRGLHTGRDYLFVLDGSKALRSAVAKMFGADVAVQRCQQHIAGRNPHFHRGETSPTGQIPMSPVAWGQAWRGNLPRRSRPDIVVSGPSQEARAKARAATKVNAFGVVMAPRTDITGRVREWGGRVTCVLAKTATAVDAWGREAAVTPGV